MLIKSLVTGAALSLAVTIGSASATEDFSTTGAVPAAPLTASEMAAVVGEYLPGIDLKGLVSNKQLQKVCDKWDTGLAKLDNHLPKTQQKYENNVTHLAKKILASVKLKHLLGDLDLSGL